MAADEQAILGHAKARDADLASTAAIQAATGAGCTLAATFLLYTVFLFFIGFMWSHSWSAVRFATAATALYLGVAWWSAWRRVDPLAGIAPLTREEATRREVEDALADMIGQSAPRGEEAVAGLADALIAGPRNLIAAWRTWRKRAALDEELARRCATLLARASAGRAAVEDDPRAAATLALLGLARLEGAPDGRTSLRPSAKAKAL